MKDDTELVKSAQKNNVQDLNIIPYENIYGNPASKSKVSGTYMIFCRLEIKENLFIIIDRLLIFLRA
jgi:hypothetical protein